MTRIAGIDCGTNSVRLLIADVTDGSLTDVRREMRIVRLGQGVDGTGRLAPEALDRTRAALAEYAATIRAHAVERIRMVATSATRDAANRDDFTAMVRATLGIEPEVISGDQEAALSFAGVAGTLPGLLEPVLVVDIGGGSTELVIGSPSDPDGLRSQSMDVGAVRMTERRLHDDPPTADQIAAATVDIGAALDRAQPSVPLHETATMVGVAGTITTLAALALGLSRYDSALVHGATLSAAQVHEFTARLLAMTREQRAALPVIHPGRVDVIAGGALVLRTVLDRVGAAELIVSEHDILDGIVLSVVPPGR